MDAISPLAPGFWTTVAVAGCALALALVGERGRRPWLLWLGKPTASMSFLVAAWLQGAGDSGYGRLLFAGLLFSAIGDAALMSYRRGAFLAGLGAFLVAHVLYLVGFGWRGVQPGAGLLALLPLTAAAVGFGAWLLRRVEPRLHAPVIAYIVALTAMVAAGWASHALRPAALVPIGAQLFWASDISVAVDRFVHRSVWNRVWGLPCYYAGQFVLAASIASA